MRAYPDLRSGTESLDTRPVDGPVAELKRGKGEIIKINDLEVVEKSSDNTNNGSIHTSQPTLDTFQTDHRFKC